MNVHFVKVYAFKILSITFVSSWANVLSKQKQKHYTSSNVRFMYQEAKALFTVYVVKKLGTVRMLMRRSAISKVNIDLGTYIPWTRDIKDWGILSIARFCSFQKRWSKQIVLFNLTSEGFFLPLSLIFLHGKIKHPPFRTKVKSFNNESYSLCQSKVIVTCGLFYLRAKSQYIFLYLPCLRHGGQKYPYLSPFLVL